MITMVQDHIADDDVTRQPVVASHGEVLVGLELDQLKKGHHGLTQHGILAAGHQLARALAT